MACILLGFTIQSTSFRSLPFVKHISTGCLAFIKVYIRCPKHKVWRTGQVTRWRIAGGWAKTHHMPGWERIPAAQGQKLLGLRAFKTSPYSSLHLAADLYPLIVYIKVANSYVLSSGTHSSKLIKYTGGFMRAPEVPEAWIYDWVWSRDSLQRLQSSTCGMWTLSWGAQCQKWTDLDIWQMMAVTEWLSAYYWAKFHNILESQKWSAFWAYRWRNRVSLPPSHWKHL